MNKKISYIVLGAFLLIGTTVGAFFALNSNKDETVVSELSSDIESNIVETEPPQPSGYEKLMNNVVDVEDCQFDNRLSDIAREMLEVNKDTAGWVKITNTPIDYPFLQKLSPASEGNGFYLHKDIYGDYWFAGEIFIDYRNDFIDDSELSSDNVIFYGHNMLNGTMFAGLKNYRYDVSCNFIRENPCVQVNTLYDEYDYKIVACMLCDGSSKSEFKYWTYRDFTDEAHFDEYISKINERTMIKTDVDVEYGDKFVTLSTCTSDFEWGRLVVVARRVRPGESSDNSAVTYSRNPYPVYPKAIYKN